MHQYITASQKALSLKGPKRTFVVRFFSQNKDPLMCTLRTLAPLEDDPVPRLVAPS